MHSHEKKSISNKYELPEGQAKGPTNPSITVVNFALNAFLTFKLKCGGAKLTKLRNIKKLKHKMYKINTKIIVFFMKKKVIKKVKTQDVRRI